MRRVRAPWGLAAAVVMTACGEDVMFSTRAVDAGARMDVGRDAAASVGTAADGTAIDGMVADATVPEGGAPGLSGGTPCPLSGDASHPSCRGYGDPCRQQSDCCSGRCDNVCLPGNACAPPSASCTTRSACCSGRCEPHGRNNALTCADFCQPNGAPCMRAGDCCSLGCNSGVCGAQACTTFSGPCGNDADCCSGVCFQGQCGGRSPSSCLGTDEACDGDGGPQCCSGVCNPATGRCGLGPGGCLEPSSPCMVSGDCCRGSCAKNAQGVPTCTAACLPDGTACDSDGDCCAGHCIGAPLRCASPPPNCE